VPRKSLYAGVAVLLAGISVAAAWYCIAHGYTLYYGDAEAHLNIARRWIDSRTPGPEQLGTVWLPLPHLLMTPFIGNGRLWHSGIAGLIPSATCFVIAGLFLFASIERILSLPAASAALLVFALNPNLLYLQSIPMTETIFAAALLALLWSTLWFRDTQSMRSVLAATAASIAASLTRYEGWFLIPFVAIFFLITSRKRWHTFAFGGLAALAPLSWLAHNQYYWSDALAFYHGPYSALAIYQRQLAQGLTRYPGDHHWITAVHYYFAAARDVAGWPVIIAAAVGLMMGFTRPPLRWPLFLLALPALFYVISMHGSGTPIFVPELWPFSWYNTRYAVAALPLLALASAVAWDHLPRKLSPVMLPMLALAAAFCPTLICWKESQVNSTARRAWTKQAAGYLREHYLPNSGIIYYFGDLAGVFREAGIPLREGLHQDNRLTWDPAILRPDLFLHEEWALAIEGDPVSRALKNARRYTLVKRVIVKDGEHLAPALEIYHRIE
jgi:hypothetical protein